MGYHECDVFQLRNSGICIEYEIKISRQDYLNDFKKYQSIYVGRGERRKKYKHEELAAGRTSCNRFYFVVPAGLVKKEELPAYAGLLYFEHGKLRVIKSAPLIHKRHVVDTLEGWRRLAVVLSARNTDLIKKLRRLQPQLKRA